MKMTTRTPRIPVSKARPSCHRVAFGRNRRLALATIAAVTLGVPRAAIAQSAPATPAFLSRSDFAFAWAPLVSADPRFACSGRLGMDIDVVDYKAGRLNITGDYEAVLGSERHQLDLNHGNYSFDGSISARLRAFEAAGLFHHESRHLNDRLNLKSISWNAIDLRVIRQFDFQSLRLGLIFDAGHARGQHYVDYTWTADLGLRLERVLSDRVTFLVNGTGALKGVNPVVAGRTRHLCGGRVDAGIHL